MLKQQVIEPIDGLLKSPLYCRLLLLTFGAIYPLAFAPVSIWPLAFLSVSFLLLSLCRETVLSPFELGYYWGLGAFATGASWVYVSIHEFGHAPVPGALFLTLLFVAYLALFKGFFGWFCHRLLSSSHKAMLIFIAPLGWLLSEYLQAWVFGGFPWLLAGYSQIDSPLAPLAPWLGIYGVSWFLVVLCASLVLFLIESRRAVYWQTLFVAGGILLVLQVYEVNHREEAEFNESSLSAEKTPNHSNIDTISIALVQPNIAQNIKWDKHYFSQIVDILYQETQSLWGAEVIVWPEGAIPAYSFQVKDILEDLRRRAATNNSQLILGIPEYDEADRQSFVAMLSLGEERQTYYKQVLVPFGEYVPFEEWLRETIEFFDLPMSGFTPAKKGQSALLNNKVALIPAICYEIVYPNIIRDLTINSPETHPKMIVTISNDAWFGDSFGPYQHMEMARMRALELGIPLIRSTNDGITAIVDYRGNILASLPRYTQDSLRGEIGLRNRETVYRQYGNLIILLLLSISIAIVIWSIHQKRGKK